MGGPRLLLFGPEKAHCIEATLPAVVLRTESRARHHIRGGTGRGGTGCTGRSRSCTSRTGIGRIGTPAVLPSARRRLWRCRPRWHRSCRQRLRWCHISRQSFVVAASDFTSRRHRPVAPSVAAQSIVRGGTVCDGTAAPPVAPSAAVVSGRASCRVAE